MQLIKTHRIPYGLTKRSGSLQKVITTRGQNEQELAYLFPTLYGAKALRRQTRGQWDHVERELKKKERTARP